MSNAKSVLGFDDNITSRRQDMAPTQYAIGKLRAARTPKDRSGAVINNLNCILYPDLYVMTLNANTVNISDSEGNALKSGMLYLYHIIVDPDESVSGGHVVTSSSVQMNVRQIAYYHNGTTEKVLTRVGTPLSSYSGSSVDLLSQVQLGQSSLVFVKELGMWVKRQTTIELAVNWTAWKEFGSGSSSAPVYTFLDTVTNGVGLVQDDTTIRAVGHVATADQFGTVRVAPSVASVPYDDIVPSANAVYSALIAISQRIDPLSGVIAATSIYANQAINSANAASDLIQNHLDNHPSTPNASYTLVDGVASRQVAGSVKTAPYLSYVTNTTEAKYTVPTMNAVSRTIYEVSSGLSNYIENHVSKATDTDSGVVQVTNTVASMYYDYIVPTATAVWQALQSKATDTDSGVVQITNNIQSNGTAYDYIVPTATAVWRALQSMGGGSSLTPVMGNNNGVSTYMHDGAFTIAGVAAGAGTFGVVKIAGAVVEAPYTYIVPSVSQLWSVSSSLSRYVATTSSGVSTYVDDVSTTLANHIADNTIHGGGGGGITYNGVTPIAVVGSDISAYTATTARSGVVKITNTVASMYYDYIVPTATAVWRALQNTGGGGTIGSGSIAAPSYATPSEWGWGGTGTGTVKYSGSGGSTGGWLLISIVYTSGAQGCVGISVNGNYVPLLGGSNIGDTKILPIPAGATINVYDGTGGGATIRACGYGSVTISSAD